MIFNPRVPLRLKLIPAVALIYILSPIDIIPDVFLGLGQLDDVALIFIGLQLFMTLTTKYITGNNVGNNRKYQDEPIKFEDGEILE